MCLAVFGSKHVGQPHGSICACDTFPHPVTPVLGAGWGGVCLLEATVQEASPTARRGSGPLLQVGGGVAGVADLANPRRVAWFGVWAGLSSN